MTTGTARDLPHDLLLPTVLFAALGGMTWAVRGCSGFGGMDGCIFAGVAWGAAWWFIARGPDEPPFRRYRSAWIILALTIGIGFSGSRGWMQWPSFFDGHLQTNTAQGRFVPISRWYGFVWLFIAGVPWAGLGACLLAWSAPQRPVRPRDWVLRIACGLGGALLARLFFEHFPEVCLPLYKSVQYHDLLANPNLGRLLRDNRAALEHLGLYLGFLAFELARRDWKNVTLIATVGTLNGLGWALCQNWRWAPRLWPDATFNWWRCWESCGGISIGLAYGVAYYLVNRPKVPSLLPLPSPRGEGRGAGSLPGPCPTVLSPTSPNLERFACYSALIFGLGLSVKNGLKGWANLYLGNEDYWNHILWLVIGPLMLAGLLAMAAWLRFRPLPAPFRGDLFPRDYRLIWLVLVTQNILAQLVTGPHSSWIESAFSFYYLLLFAISGVIVFHFQARRHSFAGDKRGP